MASAVDPTSLEKPAWTTAQLTEPSTDGYFILAIITGGWRLPPVPPRPKRKLLLAHFRGLAASLGDESSVVEATVFRGFVRPPGDRSLNGHWRGPVAYDAILLVQTTSFSAAQELHRDFRIRALVESHPAALAVSGQNLRRIADVDHRRKGVFLFNFFTADSVAENLHAWQYTAGWFQDETGLDNSTVVGNLGDDSPFSIINHCRWDHLSDILPSLIVKSSFRRFVLKTFHDNRVAPHPAFYRLFYTSISP